ncbi:alpha/beta hydrolase [Undibacterium rugosum]|uniref:alpha/beta hydrolase n=1 Tax=Undibacterium rugosum TaxID=2762291 RepID=UPI001C9B748D|nr:alpha/beta hydrolase-fold protein [Undibacterium rugosum]
MQLLTLSVMAADALPSVVSGQIERLSAFSSRYVGARHIDVWLPPGYDRQHRYPVIYMHDGQALFDPAVSWNKQAWQVDRVAGQLIQDAQIEAPIIVGIWNAGILRPAEYLPEKAMQFLNPDTRQAPMNSRDLPELMADRYLKFLTEELKPEIDRRYPTRSDAAHTMLMGSSMGGLISLYAMSEYPQVFGAAACLSTHWTGIFEQNASVPLALFQYWSVHLPDAAQHRLYMDYGTETLDALYPVHQQFFDVLVREKGYTGERYMSRAFPGAAHTETDWSLRLSLPLRFLLGKSAPAP